MGVDLGQVVGRGIKSITVAGTIMTVLYTDDTSVQFDISNQFDVVDEVVDGSIQAITSNAVHDALENKQNKLTTVTGKSSGDYYVKISYNDDLVFVKFHVPVSSTLIAENNKQYTVTNYSGSDISWPSGVSKPPFVCYAHNTGTANIFGGVGGDGGIKVISHGGAVSSGFDLSGIISYPR